MTRYFTNGKIAEQSNVIKDGNIIYEKFDINSNPLIIEKEKLTIATIKSLRSIGKMESSKVEQFILRLQII
ncbi:MAG: hypothetical protein IPJ43_19615 [Saprospiraceae bacterium]|nr:hypothetical protein [Saprospiraceae bacterium]